MCSAKRFTLCVCCTLHRSANPWTFSTSRARADISPHKLVREIKAQTTRRRHTPGVPRPSVPPPKRTSRPSHYYVHTNYPPPAGERHTKHPQAPTPPGTAVAHTHTAVSYDTAARVAVAPPCPRQHRCVLQPTELKSTHDTDIRGSLPSLTVSELYPHVLRTTTWN